VQLIVADLLRGHGHEVVVSGDGSEGLPAISPGRQAALKLTQNPHPSKCSKPGSSPTR
jgi:hypothetical protein